MENKKVTVPYKTKTIEPVWYTLIFEIDGKYKKHQGAYYTLEEAVKNSTPFVPGATLTNLWWHFTNSLTEIKNSFKNCK